MKFFAILVTLLLSGCGTAIHTVSKDSLEISEIRVEAASASMPPVFSPAPVINEVIENVSVPAPVALSAEQDTGVTTIDPIETQIVKPKTKKFVDKVTDSVMSAAEAATSSKKEIITYDNTGKIESKVVEVTESSILENLTKLVGFLSATIGLYLGFKKLREPVAAV